MGTRDSHELASDKGLTALVWQQDRDRQLERTRAPGRGAESPPHQPPTLPQHTPPPQNFEAKHQFSARRDPLSQSKLHPPRRSMLVEGGAAALPGGDSRSSRKRLRGKPPPNPVRAPDAPITRWQGMMMQIGFLPLAAPTARTAAGAPITRAMCP